MATVSGYSSIEELSVIDGSILRAQEVVLEDYQLTVPANATIKGITVVWTGAYSSKVPNPVQSMTVTYDGAGLDSNALQADLHAIYQPIATVKFGGSTELWGLTWTAAQAAAIVTNFNIDEGTAYHDAFEVIINYTTPDQITISKGSIQLSTGNLTI